MHWISVEREHRKTWAVMQERVFRAKPIACLECPICHEGEFRYFFRRRDVGRDRGGSWFWCDHCRRFDHWSSLVPKWWNDLAGVPSGALVPEPEWLNQHWQEILAAQNR